MESSVFRHFDRGRSTGLWGPTTNPMFFLAWLGPVVGTWTQQAFVARRLSGEQDLSKIEVEYGKLTFCHFDRGRSTGLWGPTTNPMFFPAWLGPVVGRWTQQGFVAHCLSGEQGLSKIELKYEKLTF